MYEKHYGKGMGKSKDDDMVIPGSPDARRRSAYSRDEYDGGMGMYGKKVSTKKNTSGTGAPNTGIQGDGGGGKVAKDATYGKKKSYKAHYGGAAGKTSKGKKMEHKVERHSTKEA